MENYNPVPDLSRTKKLQLRKVLRSHRNTERSHQVTMLTLLYFAQGWALIAALPSPAGRRRPTDAHVSVLTLATLETTPGLETKTHKAGNLSLP